MSSLNKAIIIGNVGRDPEVRTFQNGGKVCNFSVATSERWKDKNTGEKKERTQWHNVAVFNEHLVGVAEQYIKKGTKVCVEGQMETRKWQDQNGNDRYTTEIVLRPFNGNLVLLGSKDGGGGSSDSHARDYDRQQQSQEPSFEDDSEIPF